jgi:DNA primase
VFYVNNNPILTSDLEVLQELKNQCELNGKHLFRKFIQTNNNIQFSCPIHSKGQEKKPSCGITTNNGKVPAGTVHCFSCGYTSNLEEMISHCFGYNDFGLFGIKWLSKNFLTLEIQQRKTIELDTSRNIKKSKQEYVLEIELDKLREYHPYMFKRKLTYEVISEYDIGYNKDTQCITFPVRDKTGGTLFIAERSINSKFFHYPENVKKPLYGVYELTGQEQEIIICESIINKLTCNVYGKHSLAFLGLGTEYQYKQLQQLPCRKFISALDPDVAGQRAYEKLKKALPNKLITQLVIPRNKDVNDLSKTTFLNLPEIF